MFNLIHYKQAAHYSYATNMGGGLKDAKILLDNHGRPGARGTVLLITDGNANTIDSGDSSSLPGDWDWDELFDYDNDGVGRLLYVQLAKTLRAHEGQGVRGRRLHDPHHVCGSRCRYGTHARHCPLG